MSCHLGRNCRSGRRNRRCGKCHRDPCCCDSYDRCNRCHEDPCCCPRRGRYNRCDDYCSDDYCDDWCNSCNRDPCCCGDDYGGNSCNRDPCCSGDDYGCNRCRKDPCCCPRRGRRYRDNCPPESCIPTCVEFIANPISGALVAPTPVVGNMCGWGRFTLDNRRKVLSYHIELRYLTGAPTLGGIYNAAAGTVGSLVRTLNPPQACGYNKYIYRGQWRSTDSEPLTDDLITALYQWLIYFQASTTTNPNGEVRGQLIPRYASADDNRKPWCYDDCC